MTELKHTIHCGFRRLASLASVALMLTAATATSATALPTMTVTGNVALAQDFSGSIVIAKDDVTLDCAGHHVIGAGYGRGIIVGGRSGVTIKNCHVSHFATGFWVSGSRGNTFEDNSSFGHNLASDNSPAGWIWGAGFWIQSSPANVFRRNSSHDNPSDGFDVFNSPGNSFEDNIVSTNWGAGFFVDKLSTALNFSRNRSEFNGVFGFVFVGGHSHVLTQNAAEGNGSVGFYLISTQTSTLTRNSATQNGNGFILENNASGNLLEGNIACSNVYVDIAVDSTSLANTFVDNQFCVASGI
jgi:parallel beta-helix repeat protein